MKKKQYWILLPAVVLILAAAAMVFRDTLLMCLLPQIPLGKAIEGAAVRLETEIRESPLPILLRGYEEDGLNTLEARLSNDGAPVGRLQIRTDLEGNQVQLKGEFPEGSQLPGLDLYLNRDALALTSDILQGGYYGITFDTFAQDLDSIPLAARLLPPQLKGEWETSVRGLQEKMDWDISLPAIPQISREELKPALLGLWILRPQVEAVERNDPEQLCWRISYRVKGKTAKFLWEKVFQGSYTGKEEICLTFYLYQNTLIQAEFSGTAGDRHMECRLTMEPEALSLILDEILSLTSTREGTWTRDALCVNGKTYSYQWRSQTGDLVLSLPDKEPMALKLSAAEEGFRIQSSDLGKLLGYFKNSTWDVTVTKGADLTPPPYKNLDQWSLNDVLIFLKGIWSVFKGA